MRKLALTGGGRCNITNVFEGFPFSLEGDGGDRRLKEIYPRGEHLMRRLLQEFGPAETLRWFEDIGIPCYAQADGRIFPRSNDALSVVAALRAQMSKLGVRVLTGTAIREIRPDGEGFILRTAPAEGSGSSSGGNGDFRADAVVVTTGGGALELLQGLDIPIEPPVPSLFTFKIPDKGLTSLMGCSVENTRVFIPGTPLEARGALLITDWGLSGPAALKLSSYAARHLAQRSYRCEIGVNWTEMTEDELRSQLAQTAERCHGKLLCSNPLQGIPSRLWKHLCAKAGLREDLRWADLGGKALSRLASTLSCDIYPVCGRARFKEEFVTCGGVSLDAISPRTLECKKLRGLYFAGEVLDIDAVTGGFNLQAAWSTAHKVASSI